MFVIKGKKLENWTHSNLNKESKLKQMKSAYNSYKITLNMLNKFKEFNSSNVSKSLFQPFHKPKVKIKNEVVPMNLTLNKRIKKKDSHVDPIKWNKLIKEKDTVLIDARKPFEYDVGTFKGAINPDVDNFRDFPKYLKKLKKIVQNQYLRKNR